MGGLRKFLCLAAAVIAALAVAPAAALYAATPPSALSIYGKLPGLERAAISPSGDRVAIIGVMENERRLIVYDDKTKTMIFTIPVGDAKVRGLHWGGEDRVLVQRSNTTELGMDFTASKTELTGMIVIPLDKSKIYQVFDTNKSITGGIRGFHGVRERAGKYYGYFGGITLESYRGLDAELRSTDPVLYEVDLETGRATKIASRTELQENWRDWLIGADGKVQATLDYMSASGKWLIRNATGGRIAEGTNRLGGISLIGFGAQPSTLIYSVENETQDGERQWMELPLAGGPAKAILPDVNISSSYFDERTRAFLGYEIEGDTPSYLFFDTRYNKAVQATQKAFPGRSVHLMDWNQAFDRLVVMTEGPDDPQNWWIVDLKTRKADPLGTAYPLPSGKVGAMRMIRYKAGDGVDINGVLTLPPGRTPTRLPVIVMPHGGPSARDYPGFDWWAQALASRGYAVLQPNFRGSSGYGTAFEKAGHGEWGRKMQTDLSDGLAHLVKEGIVDPKRACIMGASYGGYAALAGVTLQQGLYRCAVAVSGVSDVARMASTDITESGDNKTVKRSLAAQVGVRSDLKAVSPINFADHADAPILLIHGKDDTVVLYNQSSAMAAALRKAGKPVEFVTLPGEDHWLSRGETRLAMLEAAVRFVERHNPPDPVP